MASTANSMRKESDGLALVRSLEEARGCTLEVQRRHVGFNGISICEGTVVRKVELKTVINSDNWFAINGLYGIQSLFFDKQYFLYFTLVEERKILIAHAKPFLQVQLPNYNTDVEEAVREWLKISHALRDTSGLNIISRVNFKLKTGIRALTNLLETGQQIEKWKDCVDSVWHSPVLPEWNRTFP